MARAAAAALLLALLALAAVSTASAAAQEAPTLFTPPEQQQQGPNSPKLLWRRKMLGSGSWRGCSLNGRTYAHFIFFGSLQCCDGSWHHGACGYNSGNSWTGGSCSWEGTYYADRSWWQVSFVFC
jgi:hypothetical protein